MKTHQQKINIVTLGCSKNIVDSEYLIKQLEVNGWKVIFDSNDTSAKIVIINTCGFIADAKEESVDTILGFVEAKKRGDISKIFVMGCLSQRYKDDLIKEIPEVDGFFGVNQLPEILNQLNVSFSIKHSNQRSILTPAHYAFLKIAEGCSWNCSYCAIPLIRGKHISKPIPELVEQAQLLVNQGVKEFMLIAQDSTFYGLDIYGERRLSELVESLSKIEKLEWIRIHYAFPSAFPLDLLEIMRDNPKVCKYIDIPLQHINDRMLKLMRRRITKRQNIELVDSIRKEVPNIAIRTTMLVGYPGETESEFEELLRFVKESRFERLGVFAYSQEEGTASAKLADTVSQEEKERRVELIMESQREISLQHNLNRVGNQYKVIIDRVEGDFLIGRTEFDSPEVDQEVFIKNSNKNVLKSGDFTVCRITSAVDYDLFGEIV